MKKILLIEDNKDIRENTAEILQLGNYEVLLAEDGKAGMEKAIQHKPDLIICDVMMPFLDGYGVLHAIHRNEELKNIPFIFLTAKTERSDFRKGMELGADDYITKPFTGTELLNAVDSRLKKISSMKEEFSRMEELQYLMKNTLGQGDYELFAEGRNVNKYTKKQLIYSEGDRPYYLFYIIKGKVKTFKSNDYGKELVTEICSEGDFLGYVPLLEDTLYKDSAAPLETCEIAMIPRNDFEQMINNHREIAHRFIRLLAKNIAEKEELLVNLAYNSLRKKVADALVILYRKYYTDEAKPGSIVISRGSLASIAGTAKESMIRTLSDFRNEKLIDINDDGSIQILNLKKLELMLN